MLLGRFIFAKTNLSLLSPVGKARKVRLLRLLMFYYSLVFLSLTRNYAAYSTVASPE